MKQTALINKKGVWVTMVTPFKDDLSIDYDAVNKLVEWYVARGIDGIFSVCQSSEMELLSRSERQKLSKCVVMSANGRVPVVVSGIVSDSFEEQLMDFDDARASGADAVVLISNRFANPNQTSLQFLQNLEKFLSQIDSATILGMYECPSPYKRLLTADEISICADTGRFQFFKDTCCNNDQIRKRITVIKNNSMGIFNANSATLLQSLRDGAAGYSGVMANYHPELYGWLCKNYDKYPSEAEKLADFLSVASMSECRAYPSCAKYNLAKYINHMGIKSRRIDEKALTSAFCLEMDAVENMATRFREELGINCTI